MSNGVIWLGQFWFHDLPTGDSEKIEQMFFWPFSKRANKNAYLEDPGIKYICKST